MSAVEWLVEKLKISLGNEIKPLNGFFVLAKELEEKQRNEFAISFYKWIETEETQQLIIDLQMDGELPKEPTTQQLLEIYKEENL